MQTQDERTQSGSDDAKLERIITMEEVEDVERAATPARSAVIPVGNLRLHQIILPDLKMEPIYWKPVNDIAPVMRATWFYEDTMLPVESHVANQLERGFLTVKPWTQTWRDELDSAVAIGAAGELKISHHLWPENHERKSSYAGSILGEHREEETTTPEQTRQRSCVETQTFLQENDFGDCIDHAALGDSCYGRGAQIKTYLDAAVIYADETHAHLLRPNLQPSSYYGRRPLANYIRKGHAIGICVRRGFCEARWNQLYPAKRDKSFKPQQAGNRQPTTLPKHQGRSASSSTADPSGSAAPPVKHLVLVIHGIGQKLSDRVESYHFTHVTNSLRRSTNVHLATNNVKTPMHDKSGGIMILPCNWRSSLDFDLSDSPNSTEGLRDQQYSLDDITPDSLPSIRGIISDVMLDIPYYLSHHQSTMIDAVVQEANRIFRLWCKNNPEFESYGSVHLVCHSLGSVMAIDILSKQPTHVLKHLEDPLAKGHEHFVFDTKNLFLCGSPAAFFLLLKKAGLMPRQDSVNDDVGPAGRYGCIAVENIYNIINPYDPVAFRLNPTVDAAYAASLKKAYLPSASSSWFSFANPFKSNDATQAAAELRSTSKATSLPLHVELERHNFLQEAIAEERMYSLNDNGQIDYYMRYGGGPLEIQYLTMLGAHSSYWLSQDFVRFICFETMRERGRKGTLPGMRAIKKKILAMS